jgi:hypothetical protein
MSLNLVGDQIDLVAEWIDIELGLGSTEEELERWREAAEAEERYGRAEESRRRAWFARWPNACQRCEGLGGTLFPGTRDESPDFDACDCVVGGRCPRCGAEGVIDEDTGEGPCSACGWTYEKGGFGS